MRRVYSTGKIRDEMSIPAPGDIRNVIAALSDARTNSRRIISVSF
ncbi:2-phospho-L-lactate transferase CofD family protein [Streptococcus pneumoniae]